jgi:hypothetical protein
LPRSWGRRLKGAKALFVTKNDQQKSLVISCKTAVPAIVPKKISEVTVNQQ